MTFIVMQVQCALEEWQTGVFTPIKFEEKLYAPVYEGHLRDLQRFERESGEDHILREICTQLSEHGRFVCTLSLISHILIYRR